MNFGKQLKEGLLTQNPVLVQLLGMCSTLAITTTVANGIGMGLSVTIILTLSNIFISLLRRIIPEQVRIAAYIVVIAGFVTMVDLLLQAFFPDIAESLGVFIPLIVVNCEEIYSYNYQQEVDATNDAPAVLNTTIWFTNRTCQVHGIKVNSQ